MKKFKATVVLFPAHGNFTKNSIIKYNNEFYSIINNDGTVLTAVNINNNENVINLQNKRQCVIHKFYAKTKRKIYEIEYGSVNNIKVGKEYTFELFKLLNNGKIGDTVRIFKFSSSFISMCSVYGVITEVIDNNNYVIELADGTSHKLKRHMFELSINNYKYLAKWIS